MIQTKYVFSGHESFPCKSLWLKKGYDFVANDYMFNASDAVVRLGVGKNMVASIRYWLKAFGMTDSKGCLTDLSHYIFDSETGKDPFIEDLATLWILHFHLVYNLEATLYNWVFLGMQKERRVFDKENVVSYAKRRLTEAGRLNLFNQNTLKKDIGVLLQSYVLPRKPKAYDDYSALLIDLDLIRTDSDGKSFVFNQEGKRQIPWQIFLYSIITIKGKDNTVAYDQLQEVGLVFCMSDIEVIEMCKIIETMHPNDIRYSDTAGLRQLQFVNNLTTENILNEYYGKKDI